MFKNYLKAALRNLLKQKSFAFINIFGLTISLTSFILIALFIFDEFTYDRFHTEAEHIYRVVESTTSADGKTVKRAGTGYQVSAGLTTSFPEVRDVARISTYWRAEIKPGNQLASVFHEQVIAASPGFLNIFSFPLLYGVRTTALQDPKSVILSAETAHKFFGHSDVVGQLLYFDEDSIPYTINGVFKDFPANSSLSYSLLISEASIMSVPEAQKHFLSDWTSGAFATYFLVQKQTDISTLNHKLDQLIAANHEADPGTKNNIHLQALKDIHFYSHDIEGHSGRKGHINYVYVFLIIGCFLIYIACINYMNLSTARFSSRSKEIAVRKVSGASRIELINQFLTEACLVSLISVLLSLTLVLFLLPAFNSFSEKHLSLGLHTDYRIWVGIIGVILVVTLSAGLYPAIFQSGLHPLALLKNKIRLGQGNMTLRRSLVVFQFVVSIVLIAVTMIIYQQMHFVNTKDLGFDKDKMVVIDINSGLVRRSAEIIKNELATLTQIKSATVTSSVPGARKTIPIVKVNSETNPLAGGRSMHFIGVDGQFLATYAIQLLKGRNFFSTGQTDATTVLLNETAAQELGITEALNQPITVLSAKFDGDNRTSVEKPFTVYVAGIVKDFNFQSLHEPIRPMILGYDRNLGMSFGQLTIKFTGHEVDDLLKKINAILQRVDQSHLFEYHFLDQQWDLLYRDDLVRQTIYLIMAVLAIFIAALGLLGLTIYATEQRVKEIGIRKVLGAQVSNIVLLLSKDFMLLVGIASVIAIPLAWVFMHKWLEEFAFRINIQWWIFIVAIFIALIIAMVTISVQVVKAALSNPVKSINSI